MQLSNTSSGRSIRLFLVDGIPTGIITAEIMNWTGHTLIAPRSSLAELQKRPEIQRTGVYFLIGTDEFPEVYLGETDNIQQRLNDHNKDIKNDFWERTCIISSKDLNLTKAHVKYLESHLYQLIKDSGRATLMNAQQPGAINLPEADKSDMEYFLAQIQIILPALGIDFLRTPKTTQTEVAQNPAIITETQSESPIFEINSTKYNITATAIEIDNEFIVQKGSKAYFKWIGTNNPNYNYKLNYDKKLQNLKDGGFFESNNSGELLTFAKDCPFDSPSGASYIVYGRIDNGRTSWKIKGNGKSYADWQQEQIDLAMSQSSKPSN